MGLFFSFLQGLLVIFVVLGVITFFLEVLIPWWKAKQRSKLPHSPEELQRMNERRSITITEKQEKVALEAFQKSEEKRIQKMKELEEKAEEVNFRFPGKRNRLFTTDEPQEEDEDLFEMNIPKTPPKSRSTSSIPKKRIIHEDTAKELAKKRRINNQSALSKSEPLATDPEVINILFRLPSGTSLKRRFLKGDQLNDLFIYVDSQSDSLQVPLNFSLVSYPSKTLINFEQSLEDLGLFPNATLYVRDADS